MRRSLPRNRRIVKLALKRRPGLLAACAVLIVSPPALALYALDATQEPEPVVALAPVMTSSATLTSFEDLRSKAIASPPTIEMASDAVQESERPADHNVDDPNDPNEPN